MKSRMPCPECGAAVPDDAPRGLCPRCLADSAILSLLDDLEPPPSRPSLSGRFGDYELLEEIARGGMGIVYRARQTSLDRLVAIKLLLAGELASEAEVRRFRTESEAAASLHHPNIVEIYDVAEHEGRPFYSMKLVEGENLAQRVSREKRAFTNSGAARLMVKVARAIHHAHQRGILHRDLKPGNILLDADGEPHVTDFGLARQVARPSDLTLTGMVLGSPSFMSPEQASGQSQRLTTAADIYSLGAVLYFLLTKRPPFSGDSHLETVRKLLDRDPATPRTIDADVDRDLETICLKCLEKQPAHRYGSAEALAEDLERWLRREPILARPASVREKLVKWVRRRPAVAALSGISVLAIVCGAAGILWEWRAAEAARQLAVEGQQRAVKAEQDAIERLRGSYLAQAHANRLTAESGRRFRSLEILAQAAAIRPGSDLRDEAIAALACTDIRAVRTNHFETSGSAAVPDDPLTHYAVDLPDGGISFRRLEEDREINRIPAADSPVDFLFPLSHTGRWLAVRHKDSKVRIRNAGDSTVVLVESSANFVQSVDFRANDERVAVADGKADVRVFETATGRLIHSIHFEEPPERVGYSPDGRWLAVAAQTGMVVICDAETGLQVRQLGELNPLTGFGWHPDSRRLATTGHDRQVRVWDSFSGGHLHCLSSHGEEVHHAAFHPGGDLLLSAGWDGIMVWNVKSGERLTVLPIACSFVKFSPGGDRFVGRLFHGGDFIVGQFAHGSPARNYGSRRTSNQTRTATFSPDGRLFAYLDARHVLWVETRSGRELARLDREDIQDFRFDASSHFWSWTGSDAFRQPLRKGGDPGRRELGPRELMPAYAGGTFRGASSDGRCFAVFKQDTLTLLGTQPLQELAALKPAKEGINVAISPDNNRLGLGYWHNDKVWLLEKGATGTVFALKHTLTNQAAFCGNPIFGPDGGRVAIHWGTSLAMFEPATLKQLWSLPLDDLPIHALSPDGRLLAVRFGKREVRLIAAESGTVLASITNPNGMPVRQVVFSGDNASLAVLSDALSEVFVWDLRALREELGRLGLDWSQPPIIATPKQDDSGILQLIISEPAPSSAAVASNAAAPTTGSR